MKQETKLKETEIGKIPENWQVIEFGKLLKENTRNGIYKQKKFHGTGIKIVNMKELFAYEWIGSQAMTMIDLTENEKKNFLLNPGDLIFARRSLVASGAGKCSLIVEHSEPLTFESSIIRARPDEKLSNPLFLYYLFRSSYGKYIVGTILRQVAVSGITGSDLVKLPLPIPPLSEQKDIANELCTIDAKIELNHQMNKTLEAIGQAIFKHWFVDFEFPNEEGKPYKSSGGEIVDSELGAIPKDWKVNQLKDFGDIICGKTPPKSNKEYFEGDIPFIKIPDMHNQLFVINTEDSLTKEGKKYQENKTIPEKSICVSCIATVGLVSLTSKESQTNQQINSIIPKNSYSTYYLHYMFKSMYQLLQDYGSGGSATLNINTKTFSKIKVLSPKDEVMKEFYKKVNSIFDKILNNLNENNNLSQIRDLLLPKLMSGKIRVPVEVE